MKSQTDAGERVIPMNPEAYGVLLASGKLKTALRLLAPCLRERGKLDLQEAFVDATFASAKKGALPSGPPVSRKGDENPRYRHC